MDENTNGSTATTVRYGLTNNITRSFGANTTVGELLHDRGILSALSAPESVVAVANGRTLSSDEYVSNYGNITLEQQASSKA